MENEMLDKQPNVIYMVFDDTGFSDFGCYGSEIETPNIDRLANHGLRYNQFNVTPLCSPTRACLLTGRNAHSVGLGSIADIDLGPSIPHTRGKITPKAANMAEILKDNGFNTYAVGKWHLAPPSETSSVGPFHNWPLGKGFERFYGFLQGATDQYNPDLVYDNHRVYPEKNEDYHLTEDLVDHSIHFLKDHVSLVPEKPFFLYLAFGAQHEPHQVAREYIEKYKGVYSKGWDEIREERFNRQKEMGVIPKDAELAPRNPEVEEWDSLSENEKKLFTRFQETYAGFLTHTDEQIGRLLDHLEKVGQIDNTIIVLLADNGANHQGRINGSTRSMHFFNNLEEQTIDEMLEDFDNIGGPNVESNYPLGWAQVGNTPFKYYKGNTHHGGIRVPLIIHWPKGIEDQGTVRNQYQHVIDVTPTILDILNIEAPKNYKGVEQIPMQGVSMAESFNKKDVISNRETQHYLMLGNRGIYHKGWKAVTIHEHGKPFEEDEWELYHVENDFSQIYNLADKNSDKLNQLKKLWWNEAEKYGSLPLLDIGTESMAKGTEKRKYVFYQGMNYLPAHNSPNLIDRSYSITVPIYLKSESDEGVLVSHGYHGGGYSLYVQSQKLVLDYNYLGEISQIYSKEKLPLGESTVQFKFTKTGKLKGDATIYIDQREVGKMNIPKTIPVRFSRYGIDIGKDRRGKVSEYYVSKGDYTFTGDLDRVFIELGEDT